MLLIAATTAYSTLRFPTVWRTATAFNQAQKDEEKGAFAAAAAKYEQVVKVFPEADEAWIQLANASLEAGNSRRAFEILPQLRGRKLSTMETKDFSAMIEKLNRYQPGDTPQP